MVRIRNGSLHRLGGTMTQPKKPASTVEEALQQLENEKPLSERYKERSGGSLDSQIKERPPKE